MKEKLIIFLKSEAFKYLFFGVCTTVVNFVSFYVLYNWVKLDLNLANFLGILISIIFAFFTNKFYVFNSVDGTFKKIIPEFLKFVSGRIVTMVMELLFVWLAVEKLQYNEYLSKAVITFLVIVANYFFSKFLVFKNSKRRN